MYICMSVFLDPADKLRDVEIINIDYVTLFYIIFIIKDE